MKLAVENWPLLLLLCRLFLIFSVILIFFIVFFSAGLCYLIQDHMHICTTDCVTDFFPAHSCMFWSIQHIIQCKGVSSSDTIQFIRMKRSTKYLTIKWIFHRFLFKLILYSKQLWGRGYQQTKVNLMDLPTMLHLYLVWNRFCVGLCIMWKCVSVCQYCCQSLTFQAY